MQQSLKERAGDYCAEIVCYSTQLVAFDSLFFVRQVAWQVLHPI
jgi:hypothetical protein